mgnify:CR=1 FL=1
MSLPSEGDTYIQHRTASLISAHCIRSDNVLVSCQEHKTFQIHNRYIYIQDISIFLFLGRLRDKFARGLGGDDNDNDHIIGLTKLELWGKYMNI